MVLISPKVKTKKAIPLPPFHPPYLCPSFRDAAYSGTFKQGTVFSQAMNRVSETNLDKLSS